MCFVQLLPVLNESEVLEPWNRALRAKVMGKRKASNKAVSFKRFPIGEQGCTICSSCIFQAVSNTAIAGVLSTDMKQILGIK